MTIKETVKAFQDLLPEHKCGLFITHNEHRDYYITPFDHVRRGDWLSEDEAFKSQETDELWEIQVYPATPIGSYKLAASSLESILEYLNETK